MCTDGLDRCLPGAGRGVRVGVIDSGVNAFHPHVGGVSGGIAFDAGGKISADVLDRIGHGTAVLAAIKEKAPLAEYHAVRVFDRSLTTNIAVLTGAIRWCAEAGIQVLNLSLGTTRPQHREPLAEAIAYAASRGAIVVAAAHDGETEWYPGSLMGVIAVRADTACPRDAFRVTRIGDRSEFVASPYARPIPNVPPERNLNGVSFAVAQMSGFVARALESRARVDCAELCEVLASAPALGHHAAV